MFGDPVRLEFAVEVGDAAELGQALVDGDAGHLVRTRRDDPLPAQPAVVTNQRQHLNPARQDREDHLEQRDLEPVEADRPEQHEHAGPVGDVADHAGEQGDADQVDQQLVVHPPSRSQSIGAP